MQPIVFDPHFSPNFYAELWRLSTDTIVRWFQDHPKVLKTQQTTARGRRRRAELRIPYSVAMAVYSEKCR
jgi:hypothetical protein